MTQRRVPRRSVLKACAWGGSLLALGDHIAPTDSRPRPPNIRLLAGVSPLDTLVLGDSGSETAHSLTATLSSTGTGALSQPFRRFLPPAAAGFWGGSTAFRMACSSTQTTYVTIKLWGSDVADGNRLMLFCEGKQVGWYHLGDVDPLDIQSTSPRCSGRFYYHTVPLPRAQTDGRTSVSLEIRSSGRIYGYGTTAATYYRDMVVAARPIYRVYTSSAPMLSTAGEPQGGLPSVIPVRTAPGSEVLDTVRSRVTTAVNNTLSATAPGTDQNTMLLLARAYGVSWTPAYNNAKALTQLVAMMDALYNAYRADPAVMTGSNQQWGGFGSMGEAVTVVASGIGGQLDGNVSGATTAITRRAAYTAMLRESRDHWRQNRRQYTNQSMICDLGIYRANRGLASLGASSALPESTARQYLYQSVGLKPWLGPEDAAGTPGKPLGGSYYQFTSAGLSKELGYVGIYGEVVDWACHMYLAVTGAGGPADAALRAQLVKITKARAEFRYPDLDDDGNRALRMETVIGWRDSDYPGEVVYGERGSWQGSQLYATAVLRDATLTGHAQQMLADNQFFAGVQDALLGSSGSLVNLTLLRVPGDYDAVRAQPASDARLPMTDGQPDHVFTDVENGVIAVKNGTEILYFSLYWRARYGVNGFARVHQITPVLQRSATFGEFTRYTGSGLTYTTPDRVNQAFGNGGLAPPGAALQQAYAGTTQPVAKAPADVAQPAAGVESPFSGRADFYNGAFGNYWFAMNTTAGSSYSFTPSGSGTAIDLVSGRSHQLGSAITVGAGVTVLLHQA